VKETSIASFRLSFPGEGPGPIVPRHDPSPLARHCKGFKSFRVVEEWVPAFRRERCVREDALSARCKSVPEPVVGSVIESNCVAVRRGGEQLEVNWQSGG